MKHLYKLFAVFIVIFFSNFANAAKYLNVPLYRQCDPQWGSIQLGNCSTNICQEGCALSCMAMLLKAHGTNADPPRLNNFMTVNNHWSGGCDMDWIRACQYPGSTMSWASSPAYSLAIVKAQIDANKPVIVRVILPGNLQHFIVVRGYHNNGALENDFLVRDPLQPNERRLDQYDNRSLRLFNNVITNTSVTCEFKINGTVLPNGYKIWKYPPIPNNFYTLQVTATNRNGNSYNVYLYRPNGDSTDVALNVNIDVLTQSFNISTSSAWFPNSGNYRLKILKNSIPSETWAVSEPFYISSVPKITIGNMPDTLYVGQSATFIWNITEGISTLQNGGWEGDLQIQWQRDSALNVLAFRPVGSSPYTFTVPSSTGGPIPGSNYRLSGSNPPGSSIPPGYVFAYSNYFYISNQSVSIEPLNGIIPDKYEMYANYPNPFNPTTKIKFDLPQQSYTKLAVYDFLGREVLLLANQELSAGSYEMIFEGSNLPSGVYFYRIEAGDFVKTAKMLLVK
jgi:hypothetical protein